MQSEVWLLQAYKLDEEKKVVSLQNNIGQKTREEQGCKSQSWSPSLVSQENKIKGIISLSFLNNFQPFASFQLAGKKLTASVFLQV